MSVGIRLRSLLTREHGSMTTHASVVEQWLIASVERGGIERHDDLHVDDIDERWHTRDQWIDAGVEAARLAPELRNRLRIDVTLALAFSLQCGHEQPGAVRPKSRSELEERLDWSPPSLYAFVPGTEPWRVIAASGPVPNEFHMTTLDAAALFGSGLQASGCYLLEFRASPADEYSRTVFVTC